MVTNYKNQVTNSKNKPWKRENTYFCRMKHLFFSVCMLLLMLSCQQAPEVLQQGDLSFIPMEAKRLPDLNTPRNGHALVWADDHVLVIGGHTTGFVSTATAEYFSGGRWHILPTLYPHDTPFALVLKNGDVLVGGGYESNFGIGQTWGVERYHPKTHSFAPAPITEEKRAHASALELENGDIVISGNWYATDLTEIYNSNILWTDTTSDKRSYPFILPMGNDNAWIIGATYNSYCSATENIVDQLKGEPFRVALLDKWHPQSLLDRNVQANACQVAENAFLILAVNDRKQCAPLLVNSSGFSLLPMEQPLPMEGPWGAIRYTGSFWTVPETETAWLMGLDEQNHVYLAEIAYQPALQGGQAKLSMYYSQPMEDLPDCPYELLLPDGSFITVGGMNHSNYDSSAAVFAFYPKGVPHNYSILLIVGIGLAMIGLLLVIMMRKRKRPQVDLPVASEDIVPPSGSDLGDRLKAVMEEKQLFRNKNLRSADVAAELSTNTSYLSACLNGELHTTYAEFITSYRIRYAQELMRKDPAMRMSKVAEKSGFNNEKTFLRSFKAICGVTPSEWKQGQTPQTAG